MDTDIIEFDNVFYEYETYSMVQESNYRRYPIYRIIYLIDRIMNIETLESACDDFAVCLLLALNFENNNLHLRSRFNLSLMMKGRDTNAETNICLLRDDGCIVMLQENKPLNKAIAPEGQIVAEAIAAYQYNNKLRRGKQDSELDEYTFPCMTMVGTTFTFYKIRVTSKLNNAVVSGTRPDEVTVADKFSLFYPRFNINDGVKNRDIRCAAVNFLSIFKQLIQVV